MQKRVGGRLDAPEQPVPGAEARRPLAAPEARPTHPEAAPPVGARRPRRFLCPLLTLLVLAGGGVLAWRVYQKPSASNRRAGGEVQRVSAAEVTSGDVHQTFSGLGTVTPLATITVQTQINGQLQEVGFKEGQLVKKGDFLAQIDPRPYQAALDQAEGSLAHDQGLLDQAQSDLKRYETLGRQDSIALQQVADQEFLVTQDKGTVAVDKANIETAKLNLVYCHIVAPVTGRVGLRLVDPGNYLQTTNTTGIVVITQLQPISVIFVLPEDQIPDVWAQVRAGKTLTVEAYDRANQKLIATGKLDSVDNEIDTTTGSVKLRAVFDNADESLFPNQFVNARLFVKTVPNAVLAPTAAVQHGAPGAYVFKIKPGGVVAMTPVTTGAADGDNMQIVKGLAPGDQVVVDGVDRLRDGAKVDTQAQASSRGPDASDGEAKHGTHGRREDAASPSPSPTASASPVGAAK
jgi:multidrug efflux system membrane fusion protein